MDKRTLSAIGISVVILFAWTMFFSPKPTPPTAGGPAASSASTNDVPGTAPPGTEQPSVAPGAATAGGAAPSGGAAATAPAAEVVPE